MSTGPRTQAAFIQGNQSTVEHDVSPSALFYLFQEVSKLASPIHNSFLDTNPPSTWLHDTSSRQGPFIVKKEEEDAHPFQISNSSCQHSLSRMSPYNQMKKVREENHSSSKVTTLVEPHPKCTWKVLSLINLQCERLMHQGDVEESEPSSVSSNTNVGHSVDKSATSDVTDQGDCVSVECTLRPSLLYERQEIPACVSLVEDVRGDCSREASSFKDSRVSCCVQSQAAEKADTASVFSVNRQFLWSQECKKVCDSSELDILHAPFSENVLSQTHIPDASLNAELTFNSNEDAGLALSKPALTLDHNANLTEPPCDTELSPLSSVLPSSQSASLLFGTSEKCHFLSKQDGKIAASKPESAPAHIEDKCPPAQLKSSSYNGETNSSPSEEVPPPSTQQWRTKTPRKQPHPSRSANIQDPDFQGVTFRMDTELDDNREQCRLLITSKYR